MEYCKIPLLLSYSALCYISASIFYLINTRNIGTPFNDALAKYPKLVLIKKKAVHKRRNIFYAGIILSIFLILLIKPFANCT